MAIRRYALAIALAVGVMMVLTGTALAKDRRPHPSHYAKCAPVGHHGQAPGYQYRPGHTVRHHHHYNPPVRHVHHYHSYPYCYRPQPYRCSPYVIIGVPGLYFNIKF